MGTRGMNRRAASVRHTSCTLVHHYDGRFRLGLNDQTGAQLERFPSQFVSPILKLTELTLDQLQAQCHWWFRLLILQHQEVLAECAHHG